MNSLSLEQRFWAFHDARPEVYDALVFRAREWRRRHGHRKLAIATLFEVCRWFYFMETSDPSGEGYAFNNSYRSRYARLIMEREPDLEGVFETRRLQTAESFDGLLFSEAV